MKKETEDRSADVQQAHNEIPKAGLYVSAINSKIQFIVEDVWTLEPDDEEYIEGFFLAQIIEADGADDMGTMGYELDQHEWRKFVEENQLFLKTPLGEGAHNHCMSP